MERFKENCGYNPDKDLEPVNQAGIIDYHAAFASGFVPDDVTVPDADYDGNDEPESIVGRPANTFEAIHMVESLKAAKASKEAETNG